MIRMSLQRIPFFTGSVKEQTPRAGMHVKNNQIPLGRGVFISCVLKEIFWCYRSTFVKSLEPFVKWLEEAEEEE